MTRKPQIEEVEDSNVEWSDTESNFNGKTKKIVGALSRKKKPLQQSGKKQ